MITGIEAGRVYCLGQLTKLGVTPSIVLREYAKGNVADLLEPKSQTQDVGELIVSESVQK